MRSGVYGMQLRCGPHRDVIPFFVRPQVGKPQAKVCYLASTFTYQVYGNFSRGLYDEAVPPARRRLEGRGQQSRRPQGLRALDLQLPSRRLGRRLFLAPEAAADLAARLPHLQRRRGLGPAPSAGRHPSHRLARPHGHRLRRRHRPRPARQGRRDPGLLQGGDDRHASGVPHRAHARCAAGLHRERRPADVSRRQRLLLAGRAVGRRAGRHRGAPHRGRHPHLAGRARRVLPRLRRRLWRAVAALRPAAQSPVRHRLLEPGPVRGRLLSPGRRRRATTTTPGSSRA